MRSSPRSPWPVLVLAVTVIGIWVSFRSPSACYLGARPPQESTSTLGETNMPVAYAKSRVQHANDANFRDLVLISDVPVLVDFYADWCGPCQMLAPVLEELAAETPNARVVKVNVDDNPSLASAYRISSIPSLKVFKNGTVTDQFVGLVSKSQLRAMLGR
jgi:thioredoxin 1